MAGVQYPYVDKQVANDVDIVDDTDHNKQEDQLKAVTAARGGTWADDPGRPTPDSNNPYPKGFNVTRLRFESWNGSAWVQEETQENRASADGYCPLDGTTKVPPANLPQNPNPPIAHKGQHENTGGDEMNVAGLNGELADPQPPKTHASSHEGGGDSVSPAGIGADTPTLRDAAITTHAGIAAAHHTRPIDGELLPAAHASDHETTGGDEMDVTGLLGVLANAQPPQDHKDNHKTGGTDPFLQTDVIEAQVKRIRESGATKLDFGSIVDGKFLRRSGTSVVGVDIVPLRVLSWRSFPNVDGTISHLGWYRADANGGALASGVPIPAAVPGYHSRWAMNITGAVGLPFTLRITGRSIDRDAGTESPGDTEDIAVAANGYYQSTKWWLDAVSFSIVEGAKSCTLAIWRITYWYNKDVDYTVKSYVMEWAPDEAVWSITFSLYKINDDGSKTTIDSVTYANGDAVPRAANGEPGSHKRGGFSTSVQPSTLKEGLQIDIDTTGIRHYYIEVCYEVTE